MLSSGTIFAYHYGIAFWYKHKNSKQHDTVLCEPGTIKYLISNNDDNIIEQ